MYSVLLCIVRITEPEVPGLDLASFAAVDLLPFPLDPCVAGHVHPGAEPPVRCVTLPERLVLCSGALLMNVADFSESFSSRRRMGAFD